MKLKKDHFIEGIIYKKGTFYFIRESSNFNYKYLNNYETISKNSRRFGRDNFFKNTEAIYVRAYEPNYPPDYISDSGSTYWYTKDGVYRKSDHWGRNVASNNWYLFGQKGQDISSWDYKGQEAVGFSKWEKFKDLLVKRDQRYLIPNFIKRAKDLEKKVDDTLSGIKTDITKKVATEAKKNAEKYNGYVFLYKDGRKNYIAEISGISGKPNIQVEVFEKST